MAALKHVICSLIVNSIPYYMCVHVHVHVACVFVCMYACMYVCICVYVSVFCIGLRCEHARKVNAVTCDVQQGIIHAKLHFRHMPNKLHSALLDCQG